MPNTYKCTQCSNTFTDRKKKYCDACVLIMYPQGVRSKILIRNNPACRPKKYPKPSKPQKVYMVVFCKVCLLPIKPKKGHRVAPNKRAHDGKCSRILLQRIKESDNKRTSRERYLQIHKYAASPETEHHIALGPRKYDFRRLWTL